MILKTIPRTFCITLRETPLRKIEAEKYFETTELKVKFFEGIHGKSFGLTSIIPNYNKLPDREYFISQGEIGCILSHLMLWNILMYLPDEEFLIIEDDSILCDNFLENFNKFNSELPDDWQIAYIGWILEEKSNIQAVSDNVIITKPIRNCAYVVKKSALSVLIKTNQIAWHSLAVQIAERSLPSLNYYASKVPLITHRSVYNKKDELWYSLCYDWKLDSEENSTSTDESTTLGTGWHPLERNASGYMIWSDGRGEIIFNKKWTKLEFDCIVDGEIDRKFRAICITRSELTGNSEQIEETLDIFKGNNHFSIPIHEAQSVIIVSDTFRPIDVFKTEDSRRLGIRILNGITLIDSNEDSTFVSLYSIFGTKKARETLKLPTIGTINTKHNKDGKVNIRGQIYYIHHRSGWKYALDLLSEYHCEGSTIFDTWVDRTFAWEKERNSQLRFIPYREPWIGVLHNPPNIPSWITDNGNPFSIIQSKEFQDSLSLCKGLYVLSKYHAEFIKCLIKDLPIEVLYLPTEIPSVKFNFEEFIKNDNKKIINIGCWCRKISSIYQLNVKEDIYQKVRFPSNINLNHQNSLESIMEIENRIYEYNISTDMKQSVIDIRHMSNNYYDDMLSNNIVFLDMYDVSASNVIVECIIRGTPILINPLPAVIEYLGEEYPMYFKTLDEASDKLNNIDIIKKTHEYLITSNISKKITGDFFINTIKEGQIWKSLI